MGTLAELGLTDAVWVHTQSPITATKLEGAVWLAVGWHRAQLGTLERLHTLDARLRALEVPAVALGVHVPEPQTRWKPARVRDALLARGTFAPTACLEHAGPLDAGEVALAGPDGELRQRFDVGTGNDAILDAAGKIADGADPAFSRAWRSDALGPDALALPQDVDVDDERVVLADTGHNRVLVTTLDGAPTQAIGDGVPAHRDGPLDEARFDTPRGVALDGDTVYVADAGNHALRRVDRAEGTVTTVATSDGACPSGVGADEGEVAWAQPALGRVVFLDDEPLGEPFETPFDVAFHGEKLYVADRGAGKLWEVDRADRSAQEAFAGEWVGPEGVTAPAPLALADPETEQVAALHAGNAEPAFGAGSNAPRTPVGVGGGLLVADEAEARLWRRASGQTRRISVQEPAVDADEHVVLDPLEIAPGGELELSVRMVGDDRVPSRQPPEVTGPIVPAEGADDTDESVTRQRTLRVRASGLVRTRCALDASRGPKNTVWSLPVVERDGQPIRRHVELLARVP